MVIHQELSELVDRLRVQDSRIRRHEAGGVHRMRVTLRRLRSLVTTFAPLLEADTVTSLPAELKWVAGELGGARDAQVVRQRLRDIATTAQERAVVDRMQRDLGAHETATMERSVAALDSERYSAVLRALNVLLSAQPTSSTIESEDELLRQRVWRDWRRLRRRAERARSTPPGTEHRAALHEVRKAAKRLRYSAEVLVPTYGHDAKRLSRRAKRIQAELGEVQDSAVVRDALESLAEGASPEEAFVLGGLHAQERLLSATATAHYARAWDRIAPKRNRRWLT